MNTKHIFLRRLSFWTLLCIVFICLVLGASYYFSVKIIQADFMVLNSSENSTVQGQAIIQKTLIELNRSRLIVLPTYLIGVVVLGFVFRWILGQSFKKHVEPQVFQKGSRAEVLQSSGKINEKIAYKVDKNREKLLYSHLLGAFQREGQWIDFLKENLDLYDDAQIGAAVRNIQENCRKVLNNHIQLKPILNREQGEEVTLEDGFSPDTIKLVGNVHGVPPFKGIVRHKGWKIQKVDIPEFSGDQNLDILAPAEVEVL